MRLRNVSLYTPKHPHSICRILLVQFVSRSNNVGQAVAFDLNYTVDKKKETDTNCEIIFLANSV